MSIDQSGAPEDQQSVPFAPVTQEVVPPPPVSQKPVYEKNRTHKRQVKTPHQVQGQSQLGGFFQKSPALK